LPLLVKHGFAGPVFCSESTADFCRILLPDSGHLQEKDAEYANRHGFSKHKPALPLYTEQDAVRALDRLEVVAFDTPQPMPGGATAHLRRAGHILGAASVQLDWGGRCIVFSGDLGRYGDPIMVDPVLVERADCLLVESTYGNRRHDRRDPEEALDEIVSETRRARRHRGDPGVCGRPCPKPVVPSPPSQGERATHERPSLSGQPHGRRRQRDLLPEPGRSPPVGERLP
jgi:metallo-beta-lactamase family protein